MRKSIIAVLLLCCYLWTNSENSAQGEKLYQEYCSNAKTEIGLNISFPEKRILEMWHPDSALQIIIFDTPLNSHDPLFVYESIVKISNHCSVLMEAKRGVKKYNGPIPPYSHPSDYVLFPFGASFMLKNSHKPHNFRYVNNITRTGVISNKPDAKPLSQRDAEEVEAVKQETRELISQYSRIIDDNPLTQKLNCQNIVITEIPQVDKIRLWVTASGRPEETKYFNPGFESNNLQCYAVQFYTTEEELPRSFHTLFFIDGNKTSIDKCIAKAAKYIKFD